MNFGLLQIFQARHALGDLFSLVFEILPMPLQMGDFCRCSAATIHLGQVVRFGGNGTAQCRSITNFKLPQSAFDIHHAVSISIVETYELDCDEDQKARQSDVFLAPCRCRPSKKRRVRICKCRTPTAKCAGEAAPFAIAYSISADFIIIFSLRPTVAHTGDVYIPA
jgi:hypothetical protein